MTIKLEVSLHFWRIWPTFVARGFGGNHYREASQLLWPKIARLCCLQLNGGASLVGLRSIGLWKAAGELSP